MKIKYCKNIMITIKLQGGLGNQLFQIFVTISTAISSGDEFFFIYSDMLGIGKVRPTYWNTLLESLKRYTITNPPYGTKLYTYREPAFHYNKIPELPKTIPNPSMINDNEILMLEGYFQSYKYFKEHQTVIYEMINLKEKLDIELPEWVKMASSIHFRLDDYLEKPQYHTILPLSYYTNAIVELIKREPTIKYILIFNQETD
jgi:hypothetical protein